MTYAIGRPAWASCTAVRSTSGYIHLAVGWEHHRGTRTACGHFIKKDSDYFHLVKFDARTLVETFESGDPCMTCMIKASK